MKRMTLAAAIGGRHRWSPPCGDDRPAAGDTTQRHGRRVPPRRSAGRARPTTSTPAGGHTRIVSLSPTATEMLFAIGAGDQVIAVDDQSNYPAEALEKPHDLSGLKPNVEAIAALQARPRRDRRRLHRPRRSSSRRVGIPVWSGPRR